MGAITAKLLDGRAFLRRAETRVPRSVTVVRGDAEYSYSRDSEGNFDIHPDSDTLGQRMGRVYRAVRERLVPRNFPNSVSPDYARTRWWTLTHDVLSNVANFAAGAAMGAALGASPMWSGMAMAWFNLYKDNICQVAGLGFAQMAPMAERKARPWMLAGEVLEKAGTITTTLAAVLPTGGPLLVAGLALLGLGIGTGLIGGLAGGMKGAAFAEVAPRQSRNGNLGEVGAKNGCQWIAANLLVATPAILGLEEVVPALVGPTVAHIGIAVLASLGAMWAQGRFVRNLDYHPINEQTVRDLVAHEGTVPKDDKVWGDVGQIFAGEKIRVGENPLPLLSDSTRFDTLQALYARRNYLMEWRDGRATLLLREKRLQDGAPLTHEDQFVAVLQAAHAGALAQSAEYARMLEDKGTEAANHWVVEESLRRTPENAKAELDALAKAGWSTDHLRFNDLGYRLR